MRESKTLKLAAGIVSTAIFLAMPTVFAHAEVLASSEQGIAGISAILENTTGQEVADAYNASIQSLSQEEESPYANLGVSIADDYVNVRKKASTDSKVVGKLYRGCAADILKTLDSGWVKIKSGDVEGYISTQFLAIGDDAKSMVDKYATKYATVNTQTLRVRDKKSTDSKILTLIPEGETYVVTKENKEWVRLLLGNDDDTGKDFTGYVNKDYVKITVEFKYAISIAEEKRIKKAQEEAERAEKERKEKLAQEKAERIEKARKEAEAARQRSSSSSSGRSSSSSRNSSRSSGSTSTTTHGSGSGSQIASYALKFVGNRYVWGGTSLTNGADCSGFVKSVYGDFGYSLPRTSRAQASSAGRRVSESELQPGDLIFYANSSGVVNHVAMYIGGGKIVHAANSRQGIITSQFKYRDVYCIKRIV